MTEAEEQQLKELGESLVAADASAWQPRCIARAFARRGELFTLTMQGWIDLDQVKSPILVGRLPDGENALQEIADALAAFDHEPVAVTALDPEEAVIIARKMLDATNRAYTTALRMKRPDDSSLDDSSDGFGTWLPILTCLISQIGMSRLDALECPVDQAFALIAADKHNAGWNAVGETYAQRDAGDVKDERVQP